MDCDLNTPVVAIDLDVVDQNIGRMQERATSLGLDFRPHMKTHKLPLLAHRQLEAGAVGVACQKLSEAWVMAASGVGPILITYPLIGEVKWRQAAKLAAEFEIEFQVDSAVGVEGLAAHLNPDAETRIRVDCDTGRWRTGVSEPADALSLAKLIEAKPGLRFSGLITHPAPDEAHAWFVEAKRVFDDAGIAIPGISIGGTPASCSATSVFDVATEYRAGTYVYGDRACIASGSNTEKQCAMRVHATVVSIPSADRAIIDAGSKVLSSDPADGVNDGIYGQVVGMHEVRISALTEEHGHLDLSACPGALELGQVIEIIPNHACVVTNLADEVLLHRSGQTAGSLPVAARGKSH